MNPSAPSFRISLLAGVVLLAATGAGAAPITNWQVRATTGLVSDIIIPEATNTVLAALSANPAPPSLSVPTQESIPVPFALTFTKAADLNNSLPAESYDEVAWPDPGFRAMIQYANRSRTNASVLLTGLTPGNKYQIQIFGSDARAGSAGRTKTYGDGYGHNIIFSSGNPAGGSQHTTASWIADSTTQRIAVLGTAANPAHFNAMIVLNITQPLLDTDGDGMTDDYESINGLNKASAADATQDLDGDTLNNAAEFLLLTRADLTDTDGDGLRDDVETLTSVYQTTADTGTSPIRSDSDSDGLSDGAENNTGIKLSDSQTGTNPNVVDSDSDGYGDGQEVLYSSSNPNRSISRPVKPGQLNLLAYWPFDDNSNPSRTTDTMKSFPGELDGPVAFVPGRRGVAGDYAVDFGSGAGISRIRLADGGFVNLAAVNNEIAISFWQWLDSKTTSSSFRAQTPGIPNGRGIQAHVPYGPGDTVYFDTGGIGDGRDRLNGNVSFSTGAWHHFVLQKQNNLREVWVDGVRRLNANLPNTLPLLNDLTTFYIGSDDANNHVYGKLDEFALFGNALSPAQIGQLFAGATPPSLVPPNLDTDGDEMPDAYEAANGLNPLVDDAAADRDGDTLTNLSEFQRGTKPNAADTDGDSLNDNVEDGPLALGAASIFTDVLHRGTSPLLTDTDADGLPDALENPTLPYLGVSQPGTSPVKPDSDADGWDDGEELPFGSDPSSSASFPSVKPGGLHLLAYWPFDDNTNPAATLDTIKSYSGALLGSAAYVDAGGGRPGRAVDFGAEASSSVVKVVRTTGLKLAAQDDTIAISFWQWLDSKVGSTSFWGNTPGIPNERGIQAHVPYLDDNIYFDTGGTGGGGADRINGNIFSNPPLIPATPFTYGEWHHFVFQKDGNRKEVWRDGNLLIEGINTSPIATEFSAFYIGSSSTNFNIDGKIDDFAIFGEALTPGQIARLSAGESPPSLLKINFTSVTASAAGDTITLAWESLPDRTYSVQASTRLASWPVTLNANVVSAPAAPTTSYTHSLSTYPGGKPARLFYRVVENP
jgi:Concanavalin A-like lectin/glucanases superfamily